jgi:hypothetical protein
LHPERAVTDFARADSLAALYPDHSLVNLKVLADKLTQPLSTDVEKFRAIYRWVCDNIETDYAFYQKNSARREKLKNQPGELQQWNQKSVPGFFRTLVQEHKTICSGYAYLVRQLCFHAGIDCKIIDGYGRTVDANVGGEGVANHSWNAVRLNNQWYLADPTWSSGAVDPQQRKFIRQFSEAYFLTPPSLFVRNHYPLDTTWLLLDHKPTLTQFLNGPLLYKWGIHRGILPVSPETFHATATKGQPVTFRFIQESCNTYKAIALPETAELQIVQGSSVTSVYPAIATETSGVYTVSHVFPHTGTYVVHMRLNEEYLFTYTVRVVK